MRASLGAALVGRVLGGRYRLESLLGVGASALVYSGEDLSLGRRVAVKVLREEFDGDPTASAALASEARAAGGLSHPHILRVHDWGVDDAAAYLVMELLEGGSLRSLLDRGIVLTPQQAAAIGADVARALDHAHRHHVVHRDVKPANLLFHEDGRVVVADFGLARVLAGLAVTERTEGLVGTARYAAPEQLRGDATEGKADVYALALVLIEAVTGRTPFAADSTVGALMGRLVRPLDPGPDLGPLAAVLADAGAIEPADRIDAAALAVGLAGVSGSLPPPAPLPVRHLGHPHIGWDDAPTTAGRTPTTPAPTGTVPTAPHARATPQTAAPPWPEPSPVPPPTLRLPAGDPAGPVGSAGSAGAAGSAGPPGVPADDAGVPADDAGVPADQAGVPTGQADGRDLVPGRRRGGRRSGSQRTTGRRRAAWVAALAVVVAAAIVAVVVVVRPAPARPVPSVTGMGVGVAAGRLRASGLRLAVTAAVYDGSVPAGTTIGQSPDARSALRRGGTVSVTVSRGPAPVALPATLDGQSQAADDAVLAALGLRVGSVTHVASETVPAGDVVSTTPATGSLAPGRSVALVVSSGKPVVTVPTLSGTSASGFAAARQALAAAGLGATEEDVYSDSVPRGAVVVTVPHPGAVVVEGTTLTVEVSKGPDTVVVLGVGGDSVTGATTALGSEGIDVSGVIGNPTDPVTGTQPGAGTTVRVGSDVTLVTG